jgi:Ca-activated chloride channel family protein
LVLDVSGSMVGSSGTGAQTKIDAAKEAALTFVQDAQVGTKPNIQVALISFSDSVYLNCPLTSDVAKLNNAINQLNSIGGTALGDGLQEAVDQIKMAKESGTAYFIVSMTDGCTNSDRRSTPVDAADDAANNGITVYSVAFGADADITTCQQIAIRGNPSDPDAVANFYFFAASGSQLVQNFKQIATSVISPTLHYGSRILMMIAIPLILFLPELEKGATILTRAVQTTILKRPPTMQGIRCPNCEHMNRGDAKFCGSCRSPLYLSHATCPRCGEPVRPGAKFCGKCRLRLETEED